MLKLNEQQETDTIKRSYTVLDGRIKCSKQKPQITDYLDYTEMAIHNGICTYYHSRIVWTHA